MLVGILTIVLAVGVGVIMYYKWVFVYWKKRNIPCLEEPKFLFNSAYTVLIEQINAGVAIKMLYDEIKRRGHKHAGVWSLFLNVYVPIDPEIIKDILQRAALDHFSGRSFHYNERDEPLSVNVVFAEGEKWRYLRSKLSPVFTPGKIKTMFDIILQCGHQMQQALDDHYHYENTKVIDAWDVSVCYITDVIGACAYGLECNSFKNSHTDFKKYGAEALDFSSIFRALKTALLVGFPKVGRFFRLQFFDRKCNTFFVETVRDAVNFRKSNNIIRKDLLHTLIEMKTVSHADENDKAITDDDINEIAGDVFIFFLAGYETSSMTLTFCLYELATNLNIQDRLRTEIDEVLQKHGGKISYDAIMDMTYMGQVVYETLRKHPAIPYLFRKCDKDYKSPRTGAIIKKGGYVFVSTMGLHRDPDYYPEPEKFDPERFSEENNQKRLPFTYLPFGEGPRICLALRFGLMQTKVALTVLLQNYILSLNKKTEVPIKLDPRHALLMPKSAIFLNIKKRNGSSL